MISSLCTLPREGCSDVASRFPGDRQNTLRQGVSAGSAFGRRFAR
jgi:hypothetical protein